MKKTLLLVIVFFQICLFSLNAQTNSGSTSSGSVVVITPVKDLPGVALRPRMPSLQEVYATFEDGYLTISFKLSEGSAYLYVYGEDEAAPRYTAGFSTITETTLYLGDISNAYLLIETEYGNGYEGWIY